MTSISQKDKLLRARKFLTGPGVALGVGAGDALCAKMIERAGFDFIWSSSLCVSACFAVPDANLISMSQYCDQARSMNEVISIPSTDCDRVMACKQPHVR
jgi:phosphoenolpyruvate phosphomutase